ncbi:MAG: cytochrome P450 [Cyanobacteria bacterium P01_F01_bin.86]
MTTTIRPKLVPPGPKGQFLLGSLPEYSRDPLGFMSRCARDYGDTVSLKGLVPSYLFNHPDAIEQMLISQHDYLRKSEFVKIIRPLLGNGILLSEGDFWKQQRHLIQPAFHRKRIATYAETMVDYAEKMLDSWQPGQVRDIHQDMMALTLAIAAKTFFGSDLKSDIATIEKAVTLMLHHSDRRTQNALLFYLPDAVPTPDNLRLRRAIKRLDGMVYRLIRQRRSEQDTSGKVSKDLLSMLLNMQADDGSRMSDCQVRDEVNTFLLAGHETTALVLSWALYLLGQHPEIAEKLATETQTVLEGRSPTLADLAQLPYTEWIVLEAMRLYPPVWVLARTAAQDCEIGGYVVKKGLTVLASPWVVHRDPRWFHEPDKFIPERWANNFAKQLPSFAYFPFGGGSRICIGKAFAMMESRLLLASVVTHYRLKLADPKPIAPWPSLSLRPQQPIRMRLETIGDANL